MKTFRTKLRSALFLLMLLSIALAGCIRLHQVNVPDTPALPEIKISETQYEGIPFSPPMSPKKIVYVTKDGQQAIKMIDNIIAKISSISDLDRTETKGSPYVITIEGLDGKQYSYSLFPAILTLEVENKTDHILTLGRTAMLTGTIIRLEDKEGSPYPLINTQDEAKRNLALNIEKAFDEYKQGLLKIDSYDLIKFQYCSQYKEKVYGSYANDFQNMKEQIREARSDLIAQVYFETQHGERVRFVGEADDFVYKRSPDMVYKKGCENIGEILRKKYQEASVSREAKIKEIDILKDKAVRKILSIPNVPNIITGGDYPPINILPSKREKILVPFSKNKDEEIKEIIVGVYDLPTQVDAAGIPTKRANFIFHMVAQELR